MDTSGRTLTQAESRLVAAIDVGEPRATLADYPLPVAIAADAARRAGARVTLADAWMSCIGRRASLALEGVPTEAVDALVGAGFVAYPRGAWIWHTPLPWRRPAA